MMVRSRGKVQKVLHEFREGTLHSSSGSKVTDRKQAIAIALSEAGESKRFVEGGIVMESPPSNAQKHRGDGCCIRGFTKGRA